MKLLLSTILLLTGSISSVQSCEEISKDLIGNIQVDSSNAKELLRILNDTNDNYYLDQLEEISPRLELNGMKLNNILNCYQRHGLITYEMNMTESLKNIAELKELRIKTVTLDGSLTESNADMIKEEAVNSVSIADEAIARLSHSNPSSK